MDPLTVVIICSSIIFISYVIGMLWNEAGHETDSISLIDRCKTFINYFFE